MFSVVGPGAMSGGFNFQVNDGVNFSPRQIFSITASTLLLSLETNQAIKVFPGEPRPSAQPQPQPLQNRLGIKGTGGSVAQPTNAQTM